MVMSLFFLRLGLVSSFLDGIYQLRQNIALIRRLLIVFLFPDHKAERIFHLNKNCFLNASCIL